MGTIVYKREVVGRSLDLGERFAKVTVTVESLESVPMPEIVAVEVYFGDTKPDDFGGYGVSMLVAGAEGCRQFERVPALIDRAKNLKAHLDEGGIVEKETATIEIFDGDLVIGVANTTWKSVSLSHEQAKELCEDISALGGAALNMRVPKLRDE